MRIKRIRKYLTMLEDDPDIFESNSNIIDLEFHTRMLGTLLNSKEHHVKRGFKYGLARPDLKLNNTQSE